jgi:Flp pilus assembly protein TadD
MLKRISSVLMLCFLLLLITCICTGITTAGHFDWANGPDSPAIAEETSGDGAATPSTKSEGKGFMYALSAPFRAIGRLFDGGKKKEQQPKRVNDKSTAKFESTPVMRVRNGSSIQPTAIPKSDWDPFQVHLDRGRELLISDVNGAIAELTLATSLNPKSGEAYKLLGIAYENKLLHERALKAFEAALKADENNPDYINNVGYLLFKNGDYERASKLLKRAAKIAPNNSRIWNNLALVQCQRGKFDDAYVSFVKAVGEFNGHINLAIQLQRFGHAKDAIKHLEQASAIHAPSAEVLTRLIALYDMTGRSVDAEAARRSLVGVKAFADAQPEK